MDSRIFSSVIRLLSGNTNQCPDNPIQLDRLPDHSAVELDYPVYQDDQTAAFRQFGFLVFLTALIAPLLAWFGNLIPIPYLAGGLHTAAIVFAAVMIILGALGRRWPMGSYAVATAAVPIIVMLSAEIPPGKSALVLAVLGTGIFAVSLRCSYLYLRSAAPTPRNIAILTRENWHGWHHWLRGWTTLQGAPSGCDLCYLDFLLLPAAAASLFLFISRTHGESTLAQSAALMGAIAAGAILLSILIKQFEEHLNDWPSYGVKARMNAFRNALVEWVTYNRLNTHGVGVHQAPAGNCRTRRRLLIGVIAAWGCLWAGLQVAHEASNPIDALFAQRLELYRHRIAMARAEANGGAQIQAPPLTPEERTIVSSMTDEAREAYLAERQRNYVNALDSELGELSDTIKYGRPGEQLLALFKRLGSVIAQALLPSLATLAAVFGLLFAMTSRALAGIESDLSEEPRKRVLATENWENLVEKIQASGDTYERESVLLGANARDDTPILVPRRIFREHAHILGDSGAGKTTIGLMPLITQLMRFGDASVVFIDLKADKQYVFDCLRREAENIPKWLKTVRGVEKPSPYPFRWFTTVVGQSSYAFNPLAQRVMPKLAPDQRTDILTAALGLQYGTDYGRKYFGDANYEILNFALRENPEVSSLAELEQILAGAHRFPLPEETKKAGTNVLSSVRRLARCKALNASFATGAAPEVLEAAIDLDDVFTTPQALYFALPPSAGIANTAEIARMALYSLLAAAQKHEGPRKQVYLIIDEFQRIVSNNVELFLQQARSMNIGCILSNQSVGDLMKVDADLISAVRTNTRYRQILGAGEPEDIRELVDTSGETVRGMRRWDYTPGLFEATLTGLSLSESVQQRLGINDILKATDAEGRSIAYVRRGEGYAQFGGMPFVMDSVYHIPFDEFERRENAPWPEPTPQTVVATLDDYVKPHIPTAQILGETPRPSMAAALPAAAAAAAVGEQAASVATAEPDPATALGLPEGFLDELYSEQKARRRKYPRKRRRGAPRDS